jgi:hypothetical protein
MKMAGKNEERIPVGHVETSKSIKSCNPQADDCCRIGGEE